MKDGERAGTGAGGEPSPAGGAPGPDERLTARLFLLRAAQGLVIGAGAITPGVSGGVIAVSLGLYERIISSLTGFFRDKRRCFLFLLPLALGGGAGVLLTSNVVTFLMQHWKTPVLLLFMGLVLGGTPGVIREGNAGGFRPRTLWAALGGLALFSLLAWGERSYSDALGAGGGTFGFLQSLLSGVIVALGTVIPGVSTSFLLMLFGWFEPFMEHLARLDVAVLWPAGVACVLTALALLKLVEWVFGRVRADAYYAVAGFTVGSAVFLLWEVTVSGFVWWQTAFFIVGVALGGWTSRPSGGTRRTRA